MRSKDKRGLSTVIATLLIILLVIVSVGIIWAVIGNIIETSSGSISFDEFTINLEILSANQVDSVVNVKVRRNPGIGNLEGIIFSIFNGTDRFRYEKKNVSMEEFDIKTFVLDYEGKIVSISIYPIIRTDAGKIIVGDLADVYYFVSTSTGSGDEDEGGSGGGEEEEPPCVSDCEGKYCGDDGCGGSCGECNQEIGEWCEDGLCTAEAVLNTGTVYSIWPVNVGIYFDSADLPTSEEIDYANYWVRFPQNILEPDCLQIETFVTPILPEYYDMSYIKLISSYNQFVVGDNYEIWRSYGGCSTH